MNVSFWEQESFSEYNVVICGAGLVGLSTAISIKEKNPKSSVLILERGFLPSGASTKNAGFACFGSFTEIAADLLSHSPQEVLNLCELRLSGLHKLRNRLSDHAIDFNNSGSFELILEHQEIDIPKIDEINELLFPLLNANIFSIENLKKHPFDFNEKKVKYLIKNHFEGSLHTGKMMNALIEKAMSLGTHIRTGSQLLEFTESPNEVTLSIHCNQEPFKLKTEKLIFTTNAFTSTFFPNEDIQAGRGQVLITKPIPNLQLNGIFHFDEGYYYFRNIQNRILFGGGRNLDFQNEQTTEFGTTNTIQQKLEYYLSELIIPNLSFEIDMRWSGIMAFGKQKKPIVKKISPRVLMGVRMGGMGVAIGSNIGEQLAKL